jgi:hypothetical protein
MIELVLDIGNVAIGVEAEETPLRAPELRRLSNTVAIY